LRELFITKPLPNMLRLIVCLCLLGNMLPVFGQVQISFPVSRIVFQRNNQNQATIYVNGTVAAAADSVQARLVARVSGQGVTTLWQSLGRRFTNKSFCGVIAGSGGWYDLEVRTWLNGAVSGPSTILERVGIGEVFMIVGHSNAQGESCDWNGATDDRVSAVDMNQPSGLLYSYQTTADTSKLPLQFSQLTKNSGMAPFASISWFWGELGDSLTKKLNVPILFFSTAFGGTAMYHLYRAAYNIPFEHGFCNYNLRMPYVNLKNTFKRYTPVVGLRGVLSMHGINDVLNDGNTSSKDTIKYHHQKVIDKSRIDAGHPNLAWMVAISCFNDSIRTFIQDAQLELTDNNPHVYRGPNLNQIDTTGRGDGLHFNEIGLRLVVKYWDQQITTSFLNATEPMLSQLVQNELIVTAPLPSGMTVLTALNRVQASNNISSGANVEYRARNEILLTNGFLANAGSVFKANVPGCRLTYP
jgi:Carbohydrate esterase, sialic acid-specific acetylesterase